MNRIFGLDLMRAVAVLMVLLAHGRAFWSAQFPGVQALSLFGYFGVEVFFVLSGFLIGGILIRGHEQGTGMREFWLRRWFRTLPNYYLYLVINLLLAATLLDLPAANWTYWFFAQNLFYSMPYFFPESWSLTVEEWFYLFTPLLIYALAKKWLTLRQAVLTTLLLLIAGSIALRFALVLASDPSWDDGVRKIALLRLDSLMFGILGAWIAHYHPRIWQQLKTSGLLLGIAFTVTSVWLYYSLDRNASLFSRTLYFCLTSSAFFWFLPFLSDWKRFRLPWMSTLITRISLWSYSLYLCHYPLMLVFLQQVPRHWLEHPLYTALLTLVWVALSLLIAMLTYRYFEIPMTSLRERWSSQSHSPT